MTTAPPTARPCPSKNFVEECTTASAPNFRGCCKAGVQAQLSTTNLQSLGRFRDLCKSGYVDDLAQRIGRRFDKDQFGSRIQAHLPNFRYWSGDRKVVDISNRVKILLNRLMVEPNNPLAATMWSPDFSVVKHRASMAAIPEAVPTQ